MSRTLHPASPRAGTRVYTYAQQHTVPALAAAVPHLERNPGPVERQAAIENALSMALYFIRQPGTSAANLWAATARANRALTLLKQASQGNASASTANAPCTTFGRA